MFGGARGTNSILKSKEHLNDVKYFNFEKGDYAAITPNTYEVPEPRRYHAAVIVGNEMVVMGGISNADQSLSDTWCFSIGKKQWKPMVIRYDSYFEGGIYGHR